MYPILIELPGGFQLYSYGVLLGLSCVMGGHLAVYLAQRAGVSYRQAWWFALSVIVVGLVGGRVHDVFVNTPGPFWRDPFEAAFWHELGKLRHSGRTAYGAFLFAAAGGLGAAIALRVSFWRMADAVMPTVALGLGLTRVGCFLYGCDYGLRSDGLGVYFPAGSPAWTDQVEAGLLDRSAGVSLPVLPVQLVESAVGFGIGAFLLWMWFRRPRREGTVCLLFFFSYGLARSALELVRADEGRGELGGLSTSTTIGLVTAAVAAVLLWVPPLRRLRPEAGPIHDLPDGGDPPELLTGPSPPPAGKGGR